MVISPAEFALSNTARWVIYGNQVISQKTVEDESFRDMCQSFYAARGGRGNAPQLTRRGLLKVIGAEFECFLTFIKHLGRIMLDDSLGNPFAQLMDDGATLANHHKCLAIGMEFIDPHLQQKFAICLGMMRITDGCNITAETLLRKCVRHTFGASNSVEQLFHSRIADAAAAGISNLFKLDKDLCDMHFTNKIARSAIGDLVRTSNHKKINNFPEGQHLMDKVNIMEAHCSYSNRWAKLLAAATQVPLHTCTLTCLHTQCMYTHADRYTFVTRSMRCVRASMHAKLCTDFSSHCNYPYDDDYISMCTQCS